MRQPQTPAWRPKAFKIDRPFLSVHSAALHPSTGVRVLLREPQEQVKPSGRCHGLEQGLGTPWPAQRHREEELEGAMQGTWSLLDSRTPALTSGGIQAPRRRAPSAGQHPHDPRTLLSGPDLVRLGTPLWSWRDRYVGPGRPRSPCDGPREGKLGCLVPLELNQWKEQALVTEAHLLWGTVHSSTASPAQTLGPDACLPRRTTYTSSCAPRLGELKAKREAWL